MAKNGAGYSLVELIIIVIFLGIFAAVAVPRLNYAIITKQKGDTVARKIITDLRRTRSLAISDAANNAEGYELKTVGSVPYTAYEIENIDTHATVESYTVDSGITISCTSGHRFKFGPLGNLKTGSGSDLTVSADGKSYTITIVPATGAAKCVEN
jgi:Tfp pilus assembly protein FimT